MRSIAFNNHSFEEYEKLRQKNKSLHKKQLKILIEMQRGNPREGVGKPKLLKGNYADYGLDGSQTRIALFTDLTIK